MLPEDKKAIILCFSKTINKELKYLYLKLLYIVNTFIVFFLNQIMVTFGLIVTWEKSLSVSYTCSVIIPTLEFI